MTKENLPLDLLNKHKATLGLEKPLIIDDENRLFEKRSAFANSAVIFLPKSKPLIDMTLALVSGMVKIGGVVVLAGTNEAGIGSAKKPFESNIGPVDEKIVGYHSALYIGKNEGLSANKKIDNYLTFAAIQYAEQNLDVASLPGVFSAGEFDEGTKMLLDCIPYDKKTLLDVGCGAGIIGAIYKRLNPICEVTMSDSSLIAVAATKETLKKNSLQAEVILSDVFSNIQGQYKMIVTNPPFHKGFGTDYTFIEKFAEGAKSHLIRGGEIYVVANSFLRYQPHLEKHIGPTTVVKKDTKFAVYKSVVV